MIDKNALIDISPYKHPYQIEKDYVEELFLSEIYCKNAELIFKGGTAVSKFYGSVRFSDDLDFSISPGYSAYPKIVDAIDKIVRTVSIEYPTKVLRKKNMVDMISYEISMRGPLFESLNRYQHLKIEIDKKASLMEQPHTFRRNPSYPDLKPYIAVVMSKNEILAEKIVVLLFRHNIKARDLYDIYFLLQNATDINVSLVDKKMREYGHIFSRERLMDRMVAISKIWNRELRRLLPEKSFISYSAAEKCVEEMFKAAGLI